MIAIALSFLAKTCSGTLSCTQLLDVCKRLAAMEVSGFSDAMEGAEVATLRVLSDVSNP